VRCAGPACFLFWRARPERLGSECLGPVQARGGGSAPPGALALLCLNRLLKERLKGSYQHD
jgi:hypothetical protein